MSTRRMRRFGRLLLALANATITWTILIIAPLGLWAVILCTFLVFWSSLFTQVLGERLWQFLVESEEAPDLEAQSSSAIGSTPYRSTQPPASDTVFPANPPPPEFKG